MPQPLIRPEQSGDVAAIQRVTEAAFAGPLEARLVDQLRRDGHLAISLVAIVEDDIVGQIAFSPVTCPNCSNGWGLAPVAVLPSHQRRGIGKRLIESGLEACRQTGCGFVVVLGEPAYYRQFGFLPAAQWSLTDNFGGGDAFQAIELRAGSIPTSGGPVHYAPAFSLFAPDSER